ncbi:AraC family transcriptional regulator [Kaistia sp. 32K]|uniref:AraC family transcriptional regulator n=1 Tax=Kaistia sp. 32K TaxID=2795690 RepID=UPI001915E272|nr:AraC family transcriptional regulator [Kaistia sp. 32K]BCP53973.1 AraC family transcriptional regulator [Kaistia sp. 32K]
MVKALCQQLAASALGIATGEGDFPTEIPNLSLHRQHGTNGPMPCVYPRGLIVPLGGKKQAVYGDQIVDYEMGSTLLVTLDMPVMSQILEASARSPSLILFLKLDAARLVEAAQEIEGTPAADDCVPPLSLAPADPGLVEALIRLLALSREPQLQRSLAALIEKEIALRLVSGAHGPVLRRQLIVGSPKQKIANAMRWLRDNFVERSAIDSLAARVGMSPTSFRQHFREVAGTSPLQYQKQLRLQAARQLMLNTGASATTASDKVGYVSPSQFSREYKRLFGSAPLDDVMRHKR